MPRKESPVDRPNDDETAGETSPGGRQADIEEFSNKGDEQESVDGGETSTDGDEESAPGLDEETERALEVIDDAADGATVNTDGVNNPAALAEQFDPNFEGIARSSAADADDLNTVRRRLEESVLPILRSQSAAEELVEGVDKLAAGSMGAAISAHVDSGYDLRISGRGKFEVRTAHHEFAHALHAAHGIDYANPPQIRPDVSPSQMASRYNIRNTPGPRVLRFEWSNRGEHKAAEAFMLGERPPDVVGYQRTPIGVSEWIGDMRDEFTPDVTTSLRGKLPDVSTSDVDAVNDLRGLEVGERVALEIEDEQAWFVISGVGDDGTDGETPIYTINRAPDDDADVRQYPTSVAATEDGSEIITDAGLETHRITGVGEVSPPSTSPPDGDDHPLSNAAGFEVPNGPGDNETLVRNFASAANKGWFRQAATQYVARQEGTNVDNTDVFEATRPLYVNSTYSSCNAHETAAKTVEVVCGERTTRRQEVDMPAESVEVAAKNLADEHPELAAATLNLYEPSEAAVQGFRESENADRWNLTDYF